MVADVQKKWQFNKESAYRMARVSWHGSQAFIHPRLARQIVDDYNITSGRCLDIGCGAARLTVELAKITDLEMTGLDSSPYMLEISREKAQKYNLENRVKFVEASVEEMPFPDNYFDVTICVQNGISAFKIDPYEMLKESIRVTKNGGTILYSSYSEKFWDYRLEWFQLQSEHRLIGEIDQDLTKAGIIVCKDGFRATTYSGMDFLELSAKFDIAPEIIEVDKSSVFCKMKVKK